MRIHQTIAAASFVALLAACGGGGSSEPDAAPELAARWGQYSLDFDSASLGTRTDRKVVLTNEGSTTQDFTSFVGLPDGMSAEGCKSVAPGAACEVTLRFAPAALGPVDAYVHLDGLPDASMRVTANGVAAADQVITLGWAPGADSAWRGSLVITGHDGAPLEVRSLVTRESTCTVELVGDYETKLAGSALDFGIWRITLTDEGVVTRDGETVTTFTQPVEHGLCWVIEGRVIGGYAPVWYLQADPQAQAEWLRARKRSVAR